MANLVFTPTPGASEAFSATNSLVQTLDDGSGATAVEVLSQPSAGRVIPRQDGLLTIDLRGETATTDLTFTYNRTVSGVTQQVTATVTRSAPYFINGYGPGLFYRPEIDPSTDEPVIEPGRSTSRVIFCKSNGLTLADISTLESTSVNIAWIKANPATGGGGAYYGETQALALDYEVATDLRYSYQNTDPFTSVWLLFARGDTIAYGLYEDVAGWSTQTNFAQIGESALHPAFVSTFGTGDLPHFQGAGAGIVSGANIVISGASFEEACSISRFSTNICVDNVVADFSASAGGGGQISPDGQANQGMSRHSTIRRVKSLDNFDKSPSGAEWGTNDRASAGHPANTMYLLTEKWYADQPGSSRFYRADLDGGSPKSTDFYSHNIYTSQVCFDITFSEVMSTWACHSFIQARADTIVMDCVSLGSNTGFNPGTGIQDFEDSLGFGYKYAGCYSMTDRYFQSAAGFKGHWDTYSSTIAGGVRIDSQDYSIIDSAAINAGTPRIYTASTDIGPGINPANESLGVDHYWPIKLEDDSRTNFGVNGTVGRSNFVVSNWARSNFSDGTYADAETASALPAGAADQTTRDGATIGAYTDTLLSTTGSDLTTFSEHMRTLAAPWVHTKLLADYWSNVLGFVVPTPSSGETCYFQPDPLRGTPGFRADIRRDWSGLYLPGEATNNDVDLQGHDINWNFTPKNQIRDLTFGPGGRIRQTSGALRPSGTVYVDAGGNTLTQERGSKFDLPAHSSSNPLHVLSLDSRFLFGDDCTGKVNVTARYESEVIVWGGSSVTVPDGATWTMYGHSHPGFDGTGGAAASLRFLTGSVVRFKPGCRMTVTGMTSLTAGGGSDGTIDAVADITDAYWPKVGAIIVGATSGATATVADRIQTSKTSCYLMLDDITGVFAASESLSCADCEWASFSIGEQTIGVVSGTPEYVLPTIKEQRTGLNGWTDDGSTGPMRPAATSVASTIVLDSGSAVEVDTTGLSGTYDLMDVDSLTDSGATLPSGVAVSGNKLVLTVS